MSALHNVRNLVHFMFSYYLQKYHLAKQSSMKIASLQLSWSSGTISSSKQVQVQVQGRKVNEQYGNQMQYLGR